MPSLDGSIRCETISCIWHKPGVYPNFFRMSCEIFRSSTSTNGGSSRLKNRAWNIRQDHLSTLLRGPTESPSSRPNNPSSSVSGIAFTAFDLITRPSLRCATMCSSVWKRFPSHVPKCHHITAVPRARAFLGVDVSSIAHKQICHHSPHDLFRKSVACSGDPRKHGRVDGDGTPDSTRKMNKNHSRHSLN